VRRTRLGSYWKMKDMKKTDIHADEASMTYSLYASHNSVWVYYLIIYEYTNV
jgi:hypothetical protein